MSETDADADAGTGTDPDPGPDGDDRPAAAGSASPHRPDTPVVLAVEELRKEFGGVTALADASLRVHDGEVCTLVGPNGAGKTTLFDCVMGVHEPTAGTVRLRGEDATGRPTHELVQTGLARTFQIPRVFPELSVRENMAVNQRHDDESIVATLYRDTDADVHAAIDRLLSFVGLAEQAGDRAGDLSTGQQKLLSLATTLLGDPAVVMLDEPTAGVNPGLVEEITEMLLELKARGRTFLVVEHEMDFVRATSDHVYVLADGTNLVDGPPEEALSDPRVLESYFGR